MLLEVRLIIGEPNPVRLPEILRVRWIAISLSGMVEGFELGWMVARDREKFCSGSRAQKPAKLLRTMVLRSLLNWFCRRESLLTPLELRISTDPAGPVLT